MSASKWATLGLGLALGGCSWVGQVAQDSVEGATSYYSSDHFTLVVTVPANFGFTSKAQYLPRVGQKCNVYVPALSGDVNRRQQKIDYISTNTTEQTAPINIPLEFHIAGCTMDLVRVDTDIEGRYGPSPLDIGGDGGGISILDSASTDARKSAFADTSEFRGICTWMFQLSVARIQKDGISKILSCNAADSRWIVPADYLARSKPGGVLSRAAIKGKEIKLTLQLSNKEEPSMDNRWIETSEGWRPCQGTEKSNRCQKPPTFKKFRMGGRECTIYPGCEQERPTDGL